MLTYGITNFQSDIKRGKPGEQIFIDDFLEFLHMNYRDVTGVQGFQVIDTDFKSPVGLCEIKTNYKDDRQIVIEEFGNVNPAFGEIKPGWFYKSKANTLVFISKSTRMMVLIPFTDIFKNHYESIKNKYTLKWNDVSENRGNHWQSAFRKIPLDSINGYFSFYQRIVKGGL